VLNETSGIPGFLVVLGVLMLALRDPKLCGGGGDLSAAAEVPVGSEKVATEGKTPSAVLEGAEGKGKSPRDSWSASLKLGTSTVCSLIGAV
jgi:hypothetical protein